MKLIADATAYEGAIILHGYQLNAYHTYNIALHTLSDSEKNYAQLYKEALGHVFAAQ